MPSNRDYFVAVFVTLFFTGYVIKKIFIVLEKIDFIMHNGLIYLKNKFMVKYLIFSILLIQIEHCYAQVKPCARTKPKALLVSILENYNLESLPIGKIKTNCNYNDTIKKLLLLNLKPKWTFLKIDSFINERVKDRSKDLYVEDRVNIKKPKTLFNYKKVKDSILLEAYKEQYNLHQWKFKVSNSIVLNCGFLYIIDAKPILEKALLDSFNFNTNVVKLTLARLGNKKLESEIISNLPKLSGLDFDEWISEFDKNNNVLSFIATQESISKYVEYLVTDKYYEYTSNGRLTLCANRVIMFLSELILNKEFKNIIGSNIDNLFFEDINVNKQIIEEAKKWLLTNKGQFVINKQFESNF